MSQLNALLNAWYADNGRDLPWRHTRDPYHIWLSEVILQQTRVAQGLGYYLRFTERFPTVTALAAASEDDVLKLWQGLGYYSRARNLHQAARDVVERFGAHFPVEYADVRSLKGVGDYTAAAICSFAYDAPYAVLDGNVFRVLSRVFGIDTPIDTTTGRRDFNRLAQELLDREDPATYNQAIMEFGAMQCLPVQPRCEVCPLASQCQARATDRVAVLPIKQGHTKVRERWFNYLHLICGGETLLYRRKENDIWQGLYDFPLIESLQPLSFDELTRTEAFGELLGGATDMQLIGSYEMPKHQLSHQTIHAVYHRINLPQWPPMVVSPLLSDSMCYIRANDNKLGLYAVSRLTERYMLKAGTSVKP